jgi:hypothetical protein
MIRAISLLIALSLTACSKASIPPVAFPHLPPLSAEIAEQCQPAQRVSDPSLGALVQADIDLAALYAKCQAKHGAAVAAYNAARDKLEGVGK